MPTGRSHLPRLLMLTHRFPYPLDRGDRIRSFHLLGQLSHDFRITLAAVSDHWPAEHDRRHIEVLTEHCIVQRIRPMQTRCRAATSLIAGNAATTGAFFDRRLARRLADMHRDDPFDAVLTYCTGMIGYARAVLDARPDHLPRHVLDLVDVDSLKWAEYATTARGVGGVGVPLRWIYATEAKRLRQVEVHPPCPVDAITLVSEVEARAYREHRRSAQAHLENKSHAGGSSPSVQVVRNGVDTAYFHPLKDPRNHTMIFTGVMDYWPNVDAMVWFVSHVMPAVRRQLPDARLLIVGRDPAEAIRRLNGRDGVEVVGPVEDVREYIAQASLAVAPLRIAPGVQNKVLQAMACRRAVVCSPQAAAGIDARQGLQLAVAADVQRYVTQLCRLLTRTSGRQSMAARAREQVCRAYDWRAAGTAMRDLLMHHEKIAATPQRTVISTAA